MVIANHKDFLIKIFKYYIFILTLIFFDILIDDLIIPVLISFFEIKKKKIKLFFFILKNL
jgi:hypothetical protein